MPSATESCELDAMFKRNRNASLISVSSASSCHSDSSEDVEKLSRKSSAIFEDENASEYKRCRSMSDGAAYKIPNQEPFEVFPSLPDSVLLKMGLLGDAPRERLSEEELEQKFIGLSLAFSIDAATIKERSERQRRYRDQTEVNLAKEIDKLIAKTNRIQPLCVDSETTELLSALLGQIDIVMKACSHATISAERYGAVQHENRISEAVNLMINHVNLLKQQRDSARRQLQYTKRVLQKADLVPNNQTQTTITNGKIVVTKRRASIATIGQAQIVDTPLVTRRTSDLTLRASSLTRNSRPSRLELGLDLVKIKENTIESEQVTEDEQPKSDAESIENDHSSPENAEENVERSSPQNLRYRLKRKVNRFREKLRMKYDKWSEDGTFHEICCFCALMCFSISIIILANILIEIEFSKRGLNPSSLFWYATGDNVQLAKRPAHPQIEDNTCKFITNK